MLETEENKKLNEEILKVDEDIKNADTRYVTVSRKLQSKRTTDTQKQKLEGELVNIQKDGVFFIQRRNKLVEQLYGVAK